MIMDQNYFTPQETPQQREPLPTFPPQPQYNYSQPVQTPVVPELKSCVESAFSKALASVIMAGFPIASILSIIFGSLALKNVKKAEDIANYYRVSSGGKKIAAKIMGKIGKITGIVMTCFYSLYILFFILVFASV